MCISVRCRGVGICLDLDDFGSWTLAPFFGYHIPLHIDHMGGSVPVLWLLFGFDFGFGYFGRSASNALRFTKHNWTCFG
jgi:hypothetical protein